LQLINSSLRNFVQEKAQAGSGRSDHLRQSRLIDRGIDGCWPSIFSEIGEQKQKACEPLLSRIEWLVDQIFFDAIATVTPLQSDHGWDERPALNQKGPH
jgi:hypothetical protein